MSPLQITILSDSDSWINEYIPHLITELKQRHHAVQWIHQVIDVSSGDIVFCLGCGQILSTEVLKRNKHNLVVHESDLPSGKGWSPLTWQILEGKNEISISLFEATEKVDSGKVYLKDRMFFSGNELVHELRICQAQSSIQLCLKFIDKYPHIISQGKVPEGKSSYYRKRTPKDSRLDPDKTLRQQFNLLRVVDNERYPAFFELDGERYFVKIEKRRLNN